MKRLLLLAVLVPQLSYSMDFSKVIADELASGNCREYATKFIELVNAAPPASAAGFVLPTPEPAWSPWGIAVAGLKYSALAYSTWKGVLEVEDVLKKTKEKINVLNQQYQEAQDANDARIAQLQEEERNAPRVRDALNFIDGLDLPMLRELAHREEENNSVCTIFRERYRMALVEAGILPVFTE